ncbi:MAG: rod shape-determining protein MreD [Paramuribaculum sp.]|nr:rod shape-determining protein MreD [Paramuribaculum sp.]
MTKAAIYLFITTIFLIAAQVIVFNHVCLFGVAVPFIFLYTILRLPVNLSLEWTFTISFALGLTIDIFSDTQGMCALACTMLAALRRPVLRLYFSRDDELTDAYPSISSLGFDVYFKYTVTLTLIFCALIFIIESLDVYTFGTIILRIGASTVLTVALLLGIDCLLHRNNETRT